MIFNCKIWPLVYVNLNLEFAEYFLNNRIYTERKDTTINLLTFLVLGINVLTNSLFNDILNFYARNITRVVLEYK